MQHLFGNFWFHDEGTNQVSVYERIGRRYLPIRVESEGWPERLPFETRALLQERLTEQLTLIQTRTVSDVKLDNLEAALKAFPGYEAMTAEAREALKVVLVGDNPELLRPVNPDPPPAPVWPTVEAQVAEANRKTADHINALAQKDTEILRLQAELENLKNGQKKEVPQGQDAASAPGLLGQEAGQENQASGSTAT